MGMDDRDARLAGMAAGIAEHLGPDWVVDAQFSHLPKIIRGSMCLAVMDSRGRAEIKAWYPEGMASACYPDLAELRLTAAFTTSPARVAARIRAEILPEYETELSRGEAAVEKRLSSRAVRDSVADRLLKLLPGTKTAWGKTETIVIRHAHVGDMHGIKSTVSHDGRRVSFAAAGIPADVAMRIVALIADSVDNA